MIEDQINTRLVNLASLCARYCSAVENCQKTEKEDFVKEMLTYLPHIYIDFTEIEREDAGLDYGYYPEYVDEEFYERVRQGVQRLMGEDDTFLETFEEDMKYSDTPVAASISESLADIFQPLYNFISVVKESEGHDISGVFSECKENFESYWSQTLCNVMRALNNIRYK